MDKKVPKFPSRRKSRALVTYTLLIKVKCILFILENCALMDLKGRKEEGVWRTQKIFRSYVNTHLASLSTYLSFYDQFAAHILCKILLIQVQVVAGTTQTDFAAFLLLSVILGRVELKRSLGKTKCVAETFTLFSTNIVHFATLFGTRNLYS